MFNGTYSQEGVFRIIAIHCKPVQVYSDRSYCGQGHLLHSKYAEDCHLRLFYDEDLYTGYEALLLNTLFPLGMKTR